MNWFYVLNGYRAGPVSATELIQMVTQRTITAGTQVWREGMADWLPYREIARQDAELAVGVPCHRCGNHFPAEQVTLLNSQPVCPGCQPTVREELRGKDSVRLDAVRLRQAHLKHEASLKGVALLYLLMAVALTFLGYKLSGSSELFGFSGRRTAVVNGLLSKACVLLAIIQFWAGLSLYRLRPFAKLPVGMAAGIGLFGFPFVTVLSAYVIYLVFSPKGLFILSPVYRQILAATPELRYRRTKRTWITLGLLLALLGVLAWGMYSR